MHSEEFLSRFHHIRQVSTEPDFPLKKQGKPAAVLIPLVERQNELTVLFTERASHLKHHPGQISFPGGKYEDDDASLMETALRETHEEIGIDESHITIVGNLHPYRTVSRYEVTPYVGLVTEGFTLDLDENEVANVFEVPLQHLMKKSNHMIHWVQRGYTKHPIYFIPWQDKFIWGATAAFVRLLSHHVNED